MLCTKCNNEVADNSVVCQFCGNVIVNPFDEMNKNAVGMNRSLATDNQVEQAPPQNVFQQNAMNQTEVQNTPTEVQSQPETLQVAAETNQVNVSSTVQPNEQVANQPTPIPNQINQQQPAEQTPSSSSNGALSFVSAIVVVIAAIICLYFGYNILRYVYYALRLHSIIGAKYTLFFTVNYLALAAAIIYAANAMLNHPERSYVDDLIVGAIGISVYMLFYFGGLGLLKLIGIKIILILTIVAIISFYNAYFATKKLIALINSKLVIIGELRQMLFATAMSIVMYRVAYEIFIKILDTMTNSPITIGLLTK